MAQHAAEKTTLSSLRPDAPPITLAWRPLVPIADLSSLIAAIDPALRPADMPFHVEADPDAPETRARLLDSVARLALDPALTAEVILAFHPIALALIGRWCVALGLSDEGRWRDGEAGVEMAAGERDAVVKVYRAIVRSLPIIGEQVMPHLRLLLRHPLLAAGPPLPDSTATDYDAQLAPLLLSLHSLIHHVPSLPAISQWPLPEQVERLMKEHPHRGTRLVAWRILRAWLGLFAGTGEKLKRKWVWQLPDTLSTEEVEDLPLAPPIPYPEHLVAEYSEEFGPDEASPGDAEDLIPTGFSDELVATDASSRLVDGGLKVLVRQRGADPWILHSLETSRMRDERAHLAAQELQHPAPGQSLEAHELGRTIVAVAGVLSFREGLIASSAVPKTSGSSSTMSLSHAAAPASSPVTVTPEAFVETAAHTSLLRSLAEQVAQREPTLVTGTSSSGKQSTVVHLWDLVHAGVGTTRPTREAKRRGLVVINMADRSLDSKSLLGSLSSAPSSESASTSTAGAGQFTFVEGPLTRAVRQGRWTLLLNIDQAAPELLTVIKVVAERMHTAAHSRRAHSLAYGGIGAEEQDGGVGVRVGGGEGRWVKAAEGFMLFATRSVPAASLTDVKSPPPPTFFASHFFAEAILAPLSSVEVGQIVQGRYGPQLDRVEGLAALLVSAWEGVREAAFRAKDSAGAQGGTKRDVGVRDLLRWCRRVAHLIPAGLQLASLGANPTLQEEVFVEARDVFLGSLLLPAAVEPAVETGSSAVAEAGPSTPRARDRFSVIARSLATSLGLSDERAEWALRRRVPDLVLPTIDTSSGLAPSAATARHAVKVGRVSLPYSAPTKRTSSSRPYALTKPSLLLLEKLAVCLSLSEPVLLVGETGTGKTAAVGYLAELMGRRLTALNLSNQTEAGDLVGGFRPIDEAEEARRSAAELVNRFVELFGATFSLSRNADFVAAVRKAFDKKRYNRLVDSFRQANKMAAARVGASPASGSNEAEATEQAQRKRRKVDGVKAQLAERWLDFMSSVGDFEHRHVLSTGGKGKAKFVFSFVEGPLAQAIRNGDWVLLDEVNLASSETLESLSTLLQSPDSSLVLTERGELEPIPRHPEFRLFACMNPATDVGKRDLPAGLRAKFSELWVPPPDEDRDALRTIVDGYIGRVAVSDRQVVADVAELYSTIKTLAMRAQLADGQNTPPHFSMRTLARALSFAAEFAPTFGLRRSLYEGFVMAFTMLLDERSQDIVRALVDKHIVQQAKNPRSLMEKIPTKPAAFGDALRIHHYWLEQGPEEPEEPEDYILTPSVQAKVCDLARAVLTRKVPVLIQGPTSAGKTSVVEYLARRTGHRFVRINNHEHTDIQEYVGTYVSDPKTGKLVFQEGVLVRALRRGDWIVLDELNLAPTDVLEALNRLLDDNRELVIPETGEVVRPHPHFMLFATQNPPGLYGGRKVLSRAFRNRFLEMHFGDVPKEELKVILERRCRIAPSHAERTVNVFLELQRRRQAGRVFEQKQAFATLRDLFRWGGRGPVETVQQLAEDGYMLLAERARRADDKQTVKEVLEEVLKVQLDEDHLYDFERLPKLGLPVPPQSAELVWTSAMRRLYFLIAASLQRHEPVLLVGETGAGKTSVCQALAQAVGRQLHIVGCHQNTETADLLGGQRPLRNRAAIQAGLVAEARALLGEADDAMVEESPDFEDVIALVEGFASKASNESARTLADRMRATTALFEWHDGPLVQAMRGGDLILLDEISLADDSVLERLNSVLEPSRTLVLAEKGGRDLEDIRVVGSAGFEILATMNPGGDFGKKELSPALRNRFTEIWVPAVDDIHDLLHIIGSRWAAPRREELVGFGDRIIDFARWFAQQIGQKSGLGFGLRDILGWVDFLNVAASKQGETGALPLADAFCQGALMTLVDGLGALPVASGLSRDGLDALRASCWRYLESLVSPTCAPEALPLDVVHSDAVFSVGPFGVPKGGAPAQDVGFTLLAPTTRLNAMRIVRALQLPKPILLEGSPGVGKTSLVTALAAATCHPLVRINLSDQTDLMDLLGSDLPVEGGKSGEFAWKDAPFLAAMQSGDWVLLDEMNLASQSVLEGLNSCLDHRGAVYIPELDRTFARHPDFRIFAAQNPLGQGGGRKGLPKSFLDRFSVVHMEELDSVDLREIASALFPRVEVSILDRMIAFNQRIHQETTVARSFGMEGSPWEFNLRDALRWLTLVQTSSGLDLQPHSPQEYARLLYLQRFRNLADRTHVLRIFAEIFNATPQATAQPWPFVTAEFCQVGHSLLARNDTEIALQRSSTTTPFSTADLHPLEALTKCLDMGWLAILTGPRGAGKTGLVRQVAAYSGRRLREFTMNAEVDTLELLGSFEQADRFRDLDVVVRDALDLLKHVLAAQLFSLGAGTLYTALLDLRRLRLRLAEETADFDMPHARRVLEDVLAELAAQGVSGATDLAHAASSAVATAEASVAGARFEWVDGPLVQAMKNGDMLLIEDANLCSPSVLDRLNSLFETGGRLQLAERGPVDGEIQVIAPHPNFRLVMTLDPRNGELSRAMRNRGIEIAFLPTSTTTPDGPTTLRRTTDAFREPATLALDVSARLVLENDSPLADRARALYLSSKLSPAHYALALRYLRSLPASGTRDASIYGLRRLAMNALTQHTSLARRAVARSREVPSSLFLLQPLDPSLVPLFAAVESEDSAFRSAQVDLLVETFSSPLRDPGAVVAAAAKPLKSMHVWDQSLLAAHGRFRLDEDKPVVAGLYPLQRALSTFVVEAASHVGLEAGSPHTREVLKALQILHALNEEVAAVAAEAQLDISTIQRLIIWISDALTGLPQPLQTLAREAFHQMSPMRQALTLTSGQAMEAIWRAALPPRSSAPQVAEAVERLLARLSAPNLLRSGSAPDLALEVARTLTNPRPEGDAVADGQMVRLIEQIISRLEDVEPSHRAEEDDDDEVVHLASSSDAASILSIELAAAAASSRSASSSSVQRVLLDAARERQVLSLRDVLVHQRLAAWPATSTEHDLEARFGLYTQWANRLAQGSGKSFESLMPSDVLRPALLRKTVELRRGERPTLGRLERQGRALRTAAKLQLLATTAAEQPRAEDLRAVIVSLLALVTTAASEDADGKHPPAATLEGIHRNIAESDLLQRSAERYLAASLQSLAAETLSEVGLATSYVAFGKFLWHLYVPNLPIDPAVGAQVYNRHIARRLAGLTAAIDVAQVEEAALSGNGDNAKARRLRTELEGLQREAGSAASMPVARDVDLGLLASLFAELRSFEQQIISDALVRHLVVDLQDASRTSDTSMAGAQNLQRSVDTLQRRFDHAYGGLSDILLPIRLALCTMKIGFSLLVGTGTSRDADPKTSPYRVLVERLVSFPSVAASQAIFQDDLPLSLKAGESPLAPSQATLLQVAALSSSVARQTTGKHDTVFRLTQLYERMHHLWAMDRRHDEEAADAAASLYKAKVDVQDVKTDEELEAAEFAELFPAFDPVDQAEDALPEPAQAATRLVQQGDQVLLAKLHISLYGASITAPGTSAAAAFDRLKQVSVDRLVDSLYSSLGERIDYTSAVYRIRALVDMIKTVQPPAEVEAPHHDFYNAANVPETSKALPVLRAFIDRLDVLIAKWPEQMVLHALRDRCNAVLGLTADAPVALVLTNVEQLLQQTEDWEKFADREHSIAADRSALTTLIVDWRRYELACWAHLLSTVEERFGESAYDWWFRLYDAAIRSAPGLDGEAVVDGVGEASFYRDLVGLVNTFLTSSSIGQFRPRLNLVLSFANFASSLSTSPTAVTELGRGARSLERVSTLLSNIYGFFAQYEPRIIAHLGSERAKVDHEVQQVVKLASWKDINVVALRASAVRSHHQLFKSVRKLRELLQKPASDHFVSPELGSHDSAFDYCLAQELALPPALPPMPTTLDLSRDPPHLLRLEHTVARLHALVAKEVLPSVASDRGAAIESFTSDVLSTAKELRDTALGPEEGREQRTKNLIERKKRAWRDLLNELKRIGISPSPSPRVVERLEDTAHTYGPASSLSLREQAGHSINDGHRLHLERIDAYYFKALTSLPELRAFPASHHADVRTADVQRALGHVQSALAAGLDQRSALIESLSQIARINALSERLGTPLSHGAASTARTTVLETLTRVSSAVCAIEEAVVGLSRHQVAATGAPEGGVADFARTLQSLLDSLSLASTRLQAAAESARRLPDSALCTASDLEIAREADDSIRAASETIKSSASISSLRYLHAPLARYFEVLAAGSVAAAIPDSDGGVEQLKAAHDGLVSSVLVVVQELKKATGTSLPVHVDDDLTDGGVGHGNRHFQSTLAALRPAEVLHKISDFSAVVQSALRQASPLEEVEALVARVQPFLGIYRKVCDVHLSAYLAWHKSLLKLNLVFGSIVKELATEGFCRPAENDGQAGTDDAPDGKTTEGTGMAEGSGAKNVSDEIEDESQLEGLQNETPQDKREDDQQGEDDDDQAVEMNMDFDGELEDRGDGAQESGDEEESEDEAEQQEPEEQIADVDPLDPSSVDEKMWGDDEPPADNKDDRKDEVNQEANQTAGEAEMGAKEDEQSSSKPKGEDAGESAEQDTGEQDQQESGEQRPEEADADQPDPEGEEDAAQEGDEPQVDPESGDRIEQPMDESDKLDLPEDMKLDQEDEKASAGGDDQDEGDLDLPDELPDVTEGDADADGDDDDDAERRDELDDDAEGSADGQPEEDDAALAGAEPTAEDSTTQPDSADQTEVDQADGGADDGEAGGEGQQDGDAKQSDADPSRDTSKSAGTAAQQADAAERDAAQEAGGEDEEEQAEESAEAPPMATSADGTGPSKQKTQSDVAAETSLDRPSDRSDAAPQAQRSLGDSLRDWRRRLEEIGDLAQPESAADDQQPSSNKEDGAVEYVQEGDEHETDEQALGPANEEQVKKLEQLHIGEETAPNDAMPVDEDDSPEQPLDAPSQQVASTLDLKGSTLAEADAKAVTAADLQDGETRPAELSDDDEMEDVQRAEAGEQHSIFAPPVDPEEDISVEQTMLRWRSGDDQALSADGVWRLYESLTRDLSFALTEQLRLILEPTLATRLKGDYRSGKRLNMKKIIPYIASEFTKDKIWLRRTRPSQREYQVLIAIDDSKSMADSHSVHLAFQSLALISRALTRLEVGGISVCRFGEDVDVLHPFEAGSVSDDAGAELISKFTFSQRSTDVRLLVERTLAQLAEAKDSARSGKSSLQAGDLWQLAVLISDGMCQDHDKLRALLRRAAEQKVLFVFVVIDSLHGRAQAGASTPQDDPNQHSILAMKSVSYAVGANGRLELKMDRYIDSFGSVFPHYLVLRNADALPDVLSTLLRDFFASTTTLATLESLPDELLLRILELAVDRDEWSGFDVRPDQARLDVSGADELAHLAAVARLRLVSRRVSQLADALGSGFAVVGDLALQQYLRPRRADRLLVQLKGDDQSDPGAIAPWLRQTVKKATLRLLIPIDTVARVRALAPLHFPAVCGPALQELSVLGVGGFCISAACLERLEHLVTGLHAFVDEIFPNLVSCVNLRHLELVRSQNAPASDSGQSSYWSFRALAEQVARLVALDERTAESLRIDVEVRGSLRKYDCAQRLAREAFATALAEQPGRVEVWLWYYPGRPFNAFPL
ncbi:hypothetical protein JCM8202_000005 [Rhodotorula sphaerocarpa]